MTSSPAILYSMERYRNIDSPANSRIKSLVQLREGKGSGDIWLIEGLNIVKTAVGSGVHVEEVLATESVRDKNRSMFNKELSHDTQVSIISDRIAKKLSDTVTPQGIFAVVRYNFGTLDSLQHKGIIPVTDRIQDPGNLGTIIRTADAFGIKSMVILNGSCDPSSPKVVRSSAGSIFHINLVRSSEGELIDWAGKNKVKMLVSDMSSDNQLKDVAPGKRSLVVLGNEPSGVSAHLRNSSERHFSIPIPGRAESLNVAVASAIIFYELSKKIKNA
ncbi:MAG: RNA methyltransferase [Nitrospirota bacterium]|nr:MAG: RNA methyltransferase [Nitrospirota bacterium]